MFIDGKLHDLWTFSVGYDDLWDVDPLGNEVVKERVYFKFDKNLRLFTQS